MNRLFLLFCALAWALWLLWLGGIYVVSSMSGQEVHEVMPFDLWDKGLHFVAFFLGAIPLSIALRLAFAWRWRRIIPIAAIIISIYGAVDEWHQLQTKGRQGGDVGDWTADTFGGAAGSLATAGAGTIQRRRRGRSLRASLASSGTPVA